MKSNIQLWGVPPLKRSGRPWARFDSCRSTGWIQCATLSSSRGMVVFFWSFNRGSNQQNWDLTNRWNPQNWGFHWFNQQNWESGHHLYTVHADFGSHTHTQSRSEKRIVYAGSGIRGMAFICSARVARVAVRPLSWEKLRPEPRKAEKSWEMRRDEKNWEMIYPLHPNLGCVHPLFASASES